MIVISVLFYIFSSFKEINMINLCDGDNKKAKVGIFTHMGHLGLGRLRWKPTASFETSNAASEYQKKDKSKTVSTSDSLGLQYLFLP